LVTADEIADPHNLNIKLTLSGEVLQNSSTKELIFNIPALIEHITQVITLESGDVISTGTPPGVGMARKPPRFLKDGDDCVVYVEGIGELRNPIRAEN
ncbi:MAG: fumarylacetoacetate hydrolase family protein, partial [Planctomycetaceae bacterium]|nr:fumarylacetoacetate hydrolase family protein [Planctomycetaceae bacterium]